MKLLFKFLLVISILVISNLCFSQKNIDLDSTKLNDIDNIFLDDYSNYYLYKASDFSLSKLDSLRKIQTKILLPFPFKIKSVQNPYNIPLFSENTQNLKFLDKNLVEIQNLDFTGNFSHIKMIDIDDQEKIWLLDNVEKRLIHYNFRNNKILNSITIDFDNDNLRDFLVYHQLIFLLYRNEFLVKNFNNEIIYKKEISEAIRLRKESGKLFVFTKKNVFLYSQNAFNSVFSLKSGEIVDKNFNVFLVKDNNKLYLYPIKN